MNAKFSEPGEYVLHVTANDYSGNGGGGFLCCWSNAVIKVTVTPLRPFAVGSETRDDTRRPRATAAGVLFAQLAASPREHRPTPGITRAR